MLIQATISMPLQHLVRGDENDPESENPFTLWNNLLTHFNPTTFENQHRQKKEFFAMQIKEEEMAEMFVSNINIGAMNINNLIWKMRRNTNPPKSTGMDGTFNIGVEWGLTGVDGNLNIGVSWGSLNRVDGGMTTLEGGVFIGSIMDS